VFPDNLFHVTGIARLGLETLRAALPKLIQAHAQFLNRGTWQPPSARIKDIAFFPHSLGWPLSFRNASHSVISQLFGAQSIERGNVTLSS